MSNQPVFWKMRNGELISVDDMDIKHLRDDEEITFEGYDGTSLFRIKKKEILSKVKRVEI